MQQGTDATHSQSRRWFPSFFGLFGWFVLASWVYLVLFVLVSNINRPIPDMLWLVYSISAILGLFGGGLWVPLAAIFVASRGLRAGTKSERAQLLALLIAIPLCVLLLYLMAD